MTKTSREQIDKDERKIIKELKKNAKESIDQIAKNCGFSRQKVWRIIKRLEKNKKIWTYHAVVDEEQLGQKHFIVLIKRTSKPMSVEKIEEIIAGNVMKELLKRDIEIEDGFYVHGGNDIVLTANAADIRHMKILSETLNNTFGDTISDIQILEVIFPLRKCGCNNPKRKDIREFFLS